MPPDLPRGELAKLVPSPSPVTLHYSPATTFLNENPVLPAQSKLKIRVISSERMELSIGTTEAKYQILERDSELRTTALPKNRQCGISKHQCNGRKPPHGAQIGLARIAIANKNP